MLLPPLYVICDADVCGAAGWSAGDFARACFDGGARFLQLRMKLGSGGQMLDLASTVVHGAHRAGALVVVNDRADVARLAGADGVHVGQEDLPPSAVRSLVGPGMVIGLSTHTPEQIDRAVLEPVDYIAVGPVFETSTKATGYTAVGLDRVRYAARQAHARGLPLVAIGGITLETARLVLDAGAQSVAVVTDLLVGGNPAGRVKQFVAALAPVSG